ncbi:MAG: single-stranded DNA-binding protein [Candidatus Aenigmarchaeota archaeon]|nr:single-stranded DNA-binding protein [Candidatus Aenigmarchaeota archaeon]
MNINKVILIGRLTRDPESRTTPTGKTVTSFSIATSRIWNDANGQRQEKTDFHNIVTWGKLAENCQQYLIKGQEVFIEGRIETRSWQANDGTKKYRTEIIAQTVQFGAKPKGAVSGGTKPVNEQTTKEINKASPDNEEEINVEEIPF